MSARSIDVHTVDAGRLDDLLEGLRTALAGGPALAPVPAVTEGVTADYRASVIDAIRADEPLHDQNTAVILTTSGSTGAPRGVCFTADAVTAAVSSVTSTYAHLRDAPWVLALPPTSAGGFAVVARALLTGADIHVLPSVGGRSRFDPRELARAGMVDLRPAVSLVPVQLQRALDDDLARTALANYGLVLVGGAHAPDALMERARAHGIRAVATYGMTETFGGCVHDGRPLPGTSVELRAGRIVLRGPSVALGYRPPGGPFPEPGTFVTADVGEVRDGRLRVLGRADDVIVLANGVNVSASAVEAVLLTDPRVLAAAVVGLEDDTLGRTLTAALVVRAETAHLLDELRRAVAHALGPAAVPRAMRVVDALPMLPNGKVDRAAVATGAP